MNDPAGTPIRLQGGMAGRYPNPGMPVAPSQPYAVQPPGHPGQGPRQPGYPEMPHPPAGPPTQPNPQARPEFRSSAQRQHHPQHVPRFPAQTQAAYPVSTAARLPSQQPQPQMPQSQPQPHPFPRPQGPPRSFGAVPTAHPPQNGGVDAAAGTASAHAQLSTARPQPSVRPISNPMRPLPQTQSYRAPGSQLRPVPAETSRTVPPSMAGVTAAMGAASISGHPQPRAFPQPPAAHIPQPASVADPNFLPRPSFEAEAMSRRIFEGDPVVTLPQQDVRTGIPGQTPPNEPLACPPEVFVPASCRNIRLCSGAFPASLSLAKKYVLPLGAVIQPLADPGPNEPPIPVVNFGSTGIVRCRRCRTYINFTCRFTDGGRRWMCSMCQYPNDCPSDYFSPLDEVGRRRDAAQRPELHRGSIEFVAPAEYMVRPPMPPVYLFVLEVTPAAMACGALTAMVSGIRASIDAMPNEGRTRIGIVTFDSCVSFYTLPAGENGDPSVSVVADIQDMFIPTPDNILVQLSDCRPAFEKALDIILSACKVAQQSPKSARAVASASCLGAALQGAQKVMEYYGGKMVVLASSRPNAGPGTLRDRAENNALGTDRERAVFRPESTFYREMAVEFSKFQISCDLFVCPPPPAVFMDVATLAQLPKFTGGDLLRTAGFEAHKDHSRLQRAVYRTLTRTTGFEAVMRVRASKSVRCSQFHGRFFVRSTDLLAMPNVDCDKTYAVQFSFDESTLSDGPFCVQVALLYTTTSGERRIRVHTVAVPVTNSISDLFCRVDSPAVANVYLRMAAEAVKDRALNELKKNLNMKVVSGLASYRTVCQQQYQGIGGPGGLTGSSGATQLFLPDAMNLLPLYMHGLLRTALLSHDSAAACFMRFDDKSSLVHAVDIMNVPQSTALLYPNLMPVLPPAHPMPGTANGGTKAPLVFPAGAPASTSSLKMDTGILMDDGRSLVLCLGNNVVPPFAGELLGLPAQSIGGDVDVRQLAYRLLEPVERKGAVAYVRSVVSQVLSARPAGTDFQVVLAGGPMHSRVQALCVEERTSGCIGYKEYLMELSREVAAKTAAVRQ